MISKEIRNKLKGCDQSVTDIVEAYNDKNRKLEKEIAKLRVNLASKNHKISGLKSEINRLTKKLERNEEGIKIVVEREGEQFQK